jgi:hypothetical protein
MASGFDKKADDWNIAAHVMLRKTPESLSGVAFKFGSPSIRVAAQVSLLGRISGSNIPTSEGLCTIRGGKFAELYVEAIFHT